MGKQDGQVAKGGGDPFASGDFLHSRAHGLASLRTTVDEARSICRKDVTKLSSDDWEWLKRCIHVLDREIASLLADTVNQLDVVVPGLLTGLQRPIFRRISPLSILEEIVPTYREQGAGRGIDVRLTDLSAGTAPIELEVGMVRRAFHNALSNAIKYSYRGADGRYRYVAVRCSRQLPVTGGFVVAFESYGIGISDEEKRQVWNARYRGKAAKKEQTLGSGLGLTQIRECMKRHRGKCDIDSVPVEGGAHKTTLTLSFPVKTDIRRHY